MLQSTPKELFAGWHFTMDGIVSAEKAPNLGNLRFIETVLLDLVKRLEMQVLVAPNFVEVPTNPAKVETDDDEGGVTGTCIITTSHLSIHTWPLRERFSMDVFSCREFDDAKCDKFLREHFGVTRATTHWIRRNWP